MNKRSISLMELLVILMLITVVILGITPVAIYLEKSVGESIEFSNMYSQLNYALEDLRLHSVSAVQIDDGSLFAGPGTENSLKFRGQRDIYNITPDDAADDSWYEYSLNQDNGNLVLIKDNDNDAQEVLVEGRFHPTLIFNYQAGDEPNFITVTISATSVRDPTKVISRTEGIRFWFVSVLTT